MEQQAAQGDFAACRVTLAALPSELRKLRSEARTMALPIILLTGRDGESDKITGLEAGAVGHLQQAMGWLMQNGMANPDNAGAAATDFMELFGLVVFGYMWAKMAKVANDKIAASGPTPYLKTKLVTGKFFMERMIPETAAHLARLQSGSATTMELAAEAF
jgi:hypothetical protein